VADENDGAEKTEDPTQKRLDDALERGDVAKSQEVNTRFMMAGAALVLTSFAGSIGSALQTPLRNLLANSWMIRTDAKVCWRWLRDLEYVLIVALGVPLLLLALAAIAGNMVQHRLCGPANRSSRSSASCHPGGRQAHLRSRRRPTSPRACSR